MHTATGVSSLLFLSLLPLQASDLDEFKVKRQEVFEFVRKPEVKRSGDRVEISFESKGCCDLSVAVEDAEGKIVRHLVSGVLGPHAPEPLQKNALKQSLVWDSKDDQGRYVDDLSRCSVRVSLGLKPRFEKTLFWSPYKRIGAMAPLVQAAPDGMYVYEGFATDHLRVHSRDGAYLRTVYPFPADKLEQVGGLAWHDYPHGFRAPLKAGMYQQTLFTCGSNAPNTKGSIDGNAAHALAIRDGKVALAMRKLNRMATGGGGCTEPLEGGKTSLRQLGVSQLEGQKTDEITPTSAALSPDGQWLYLAGYSYHHYGNCDTLNVVTRVPFAGTGAAGEPQRFAGKVVYKDGLALGQGSGEGEFKNAASVDCDEQGRVYVADFGNNRLQVFSPEGKFLKPIPVTKPAVVRVHRRTQELYVFSWPIYSRLGMAEGVSFQPTLYRLGTFDDPKPLAALELPMGKGVCQGASYKEFPACHLLYSGEVDSWSERPTVWIGREAHNDGELGQAPGWGGRKDGWENTGLRVLREKNGKFETLLDFGVQTVADVKRARAPTWGIQKFAFDPKRRKLYLHEGDSGMYSKAVRELMELNPETGETAFVTLPFTAQDVTFDDEGQLYLRTMDVIARYDPATFPRSERPGLPSSLPNSMWREIPWDYGEELSKVGDGNGVLAPVIGGLVMPSQYPVCAHTGGFYVSHKGNVAAACNVRVASRGGVPTGVRRWGTLTGEQGVVNAKPYQPRLYPGRGMTPTSCCLHVWDKHGKFLYEDAVPGMTQVDGVGLDRNDRLYVMATPARVLDGKRYFNEYSSTLMRFQPKQGRLISSSAHAPVPLAPEDRPKGVPQLEGGIMDSIWTEGADWFYGGVGYASFNARSGDGGCACRFARFCLDGFARSIAPEPGQFGVAVVDSAGNLILRIGKYGNVEDGVPLKKEGGPAAPRSIGGDEVALFHANYVGTDTDRRIFISDTGNGRILSVKLEYQAEERVPLRDASGMDPAPGTR